MNAPWLTVMRREIVVRLTDKAFILSTLLTVGVIAAFMAFSGWQAERTHSFQVAYVAQDAAGAQALARTASAVDPKVKVTVGEVADRASALSELADGRADAWLHQGANGWVLTSEKGVSTSLLAVTQAVMRGVTLQAQAEKLGTTVAALEAGSTVTEDYLQGNAERTNVAMAVSFVFAFLFYIASLLFGIQLANSVVEEKQNRIVEIIATSIPVRQLLAGKVAGMTLLALAQIAVYSAVGLVGMSFTKYRDYLPGISGSVAWFLAFFLAGFLALSTLWAVAGALASRAEDIQSTSMPLTMVVMGTFFAGLLAKGRVEEILSFVPPVSAVVMPKRIVQGGVPIWEPVLALVLLAAFAAATVWVGEKVYRRALLQTGGRVSLKAAWSARD